MACRLKILAPGSHLPAGRPPPSSVTAYNGTLVAVGRWNGCSGRVVDGAEAWKSPQIKSSNFCIKFEESSWEWDPRKSDRLGIALILLETVILAGFQLGFNSST